MTGKERSKVLTGLVSRIERGIARGLAWPSDALAHSRQHLPEMPNLKQNPEKASSDVYLFDASVGIEKSKVASSIQNTQGYGAELCPPMVS